MRPCQVVLDPPPSTGNLPPNLTFFSKLVRNYCVECTEINMEAFGACVDIKLCSAWT